METFGCRHMGQSIVFIVEAFYKRAQLDGMDPWSKGDNVNKLIKYVPLDQVSKIRACYHTAKQDPSVLLDPPSEPVAQTG
jgi:hypothetical protein